METNPEKNLPENPPETTDTAELSPDINEELLSRVSAVEKNVSPNAALDKEELETVLKNPNAINVLLRDKGKDIVGFVIALPNNEVYEELHSDDPCFENNPKRLYVYDIEIEEKNRGLSNFLSMTRPLIEEAETRGFEMLTMHARTSEKLSEVLQGRYQAHKLRTMENWQGWGEPYDYLEIKLHPRTSPTKTS